jgi:hypothetical protein
MTNEKPQLDTPLILLDWVIIDDNLKKRHGQNILIKRGII